MFWLWACTTDPIVVERPPVESLARARLAYRGELRYFDDTLAGLWADLDGRGLLDDTLVVFFTDHGEQQMERGVLDHGFELYAEENRSVAGFWAKTLVPGTWTGPTLHTDLPVTVLGLLGLPSTGTGIPLGQALDHGVPQLSIVRGDRQLHQDWDGVHTFQRCGTR